MKLMKKSNTVAVVAFNLARLRALATNASGGKGISQGELSRRAGGSPMLVSMLERGIYKRGARAETLLAIAGALEVPMDELFRPIVKRKRGGSHARPRARARKRRAA